MRQRRAGAAALWPRVRSLVGQPLVAAITIALVIVAPILAVGEASDNEARAQARAQMFAAGASVADEEARRIERYFDVARRDLIAAAAGDVRGAIAAGNIDGLIAAMDRAAGALLNRGAGERGVVPRNAIDTARVALTDPSGALILQEDPAASAACLNFRTTSQLSAKAECTRQVVDGAQQYRGRVDPRAVELLASRDPSSRSWLSEPFVVVGEGGLAVAVSIATLITPSDESLTAVGVLIVDVRIADALAADVAAMLARAEDVYVIDRAGRYVVGARDQAIPPLTDLTGSPLVAEAVRSQPIVTSVRGPVTIREDRPDPFTGTTRPFATSVMTNLGQGTKGLGARSYGWQVLVVPDQTPARNVEATLVQLRLARLGVGVILVIGAFLLASAIRAISRQRAALAESLEQQTAIAIENVRLFNEIQDKSRELEAASRHKSEFLANMSHELRTPLNAVIGFSDVLEQGMVGQLTDKQAEYVRDISTSGKHLLDLVNEILDLSKVEAGRMELELSAFALADTINAAVAFVRERASRQRIEVAQDVLPDLGTITADERKIRQVLLNLLSNAVKFTPDGGWIGVTARRADGEVTVSVRDTGIGIAPEDQPTVFDEFRQVGKATDRSREGTGLGLTLAKRFIELHGGRIWLESEVGQGSTFTFALPIRTLVEQGVRS